MKSILDRAFRYVPSTQTDLSKTFARIRREREAARKQAEENEREAQVKVEKLPARKLK